MDEPGFTLFDPKHLNIEENNDEEEDEEAIRYEQEKAEEIKEEVERMFDNWTDDDEDHKGGHSTSSSDEEDGSQVEKIRNSVNNGQVIHHTNGLIFHNLSDISEHSVNESDLSRNSVPDSSAVTNGKVFTPSRRLSLKYLKRSGGSMKNHTDLGGSGDADNHYQLVYLNNSHDGHNQSGKPVFLTEKSQSFEKSEDDLTEAYKEAEYGVDQLKVLLAVKQRELEQLTEELRSEREQTSSIRQETFRRFALLEAEKERAVLSRTELEKLLVSSKEKINTLQTEVDSLRESISAMEKDKRKSEETEELGRIQMQELEDRIAMMERCDPNKNIIKQQDMMVKELKNKYQENVGRLQQQIEALNKQLLQKEEDCKGMERRVTELQRQHEMLLVDKADTINQLSRQLEASQAQCSQLMAANVSVENVRLQNQLDEAVRDKEQLSKAVKSLQIQCNLMHSDLAQYESVSKLTLPQSNSSSDESDSIIQLGMSSRQSRSQPLGHTNMNHTDTVCKLKAELTRSLLNQKAKRAEIQRLQEIITSKEDEVQEMVKRERTYLAQTEMLNDRLNKMAAEFTFIQSKKENLESNDSTEEISKLKSEIAELHKEKANMEKNNLELQQKLKKTITDFEAKKQEMSDYNKKHLDETLAKVKKEMEENTNLRIKEYSVRLEQSLKEVSEVKEMYVSICTEKEELALSLQQKTTKLQRAVAERDQLSVELKELTAVRDQLARRLNEKEMSKTGDQTLNEIQDELVNCKKLSDQLALSLQQRSAELQQVTEERDRLRVNLQELTVKQDQLATTLSNTETARTKDLDVDKLQDKLIKSKDMRDQLAVQISAAKKENEELTAEIIRLKTELHKAELPKNVAQRNESQLSAECVRLREELSAMSARHTLEISSARNELRDSRERVIQLEKCALMQFETEMKILRQDRDMLKTKCDEKEVQIKKLIESRKRAPAMVSVATETEEEEEGGEERQHRERVRCQEEYNRTLEAMEQVHQQSLRRLMEDNNNERMTLEQQHKLELQAMQEHTKQLTVNFFAKEIKKLEAKYVDEVSSIVESLQKSLSEKNTQVENLQQKMVDAEQEWWEKLSALNSQMEAEKEMAAQMMVQWAEEMKNIQEELKKKEVVIDNQRTKLTKALAAEKRHREKLVRNNERFQTQYKEKSAEFKTILEQLKEDAYNNINKLDKVYEEKVKELKMSFEKKLQQKNRGKDI